MNQTIMLHHVKSITVDSITKEVMDEKGMTTPDRYYTRRINLELETGINLQITLFSDRPKGLNVKKGKTD